MTKIYRGVQFHLLILVILCKSLMMTGKLNICSRREQDLIKMLKSYQIYLPSLMQKNIKILEII